MFNSITRKRAIHLISEDINKLSNKDLENILEYISDTKHGQLVSENDGFAVHDDYHPTMDKDW